MQSADQARRPRRERPGRALGALQEFLRTQAAGAAALAAAAVVALLWANLDAGSYAEVWSTPVELSAGGLEVSTDAKTVVKNVLMSVFFLVVGLEIKRELSVGELRDRRVAVLPVFAALGGMVLPAVIFLAVTAGTGASQGWGIPMATDIAFAVAALRLLGARVPVQLAAFLLAVAVVDDIGAILVIAVAYTDAVAPAWLGASALALAGVALLLRRGGAPLAALVILGLLAWACMAQSGVSPTIAAVAFGLLMPARGPRPLLLRMEHGLGPWSAFLVLPVFALAFAGIPIGVDDLSSAAGSRVALGVVLGLVVGKTLGVTLGALLAVRLGVGRLPRGVGLGQVVGAGALAGIGFTVSIFVAALAYDDPAPANEARIGILVGSIAAAAIGTAILLGSGRRRSSRDRNTKRTRG